jgi:hypothetical protein
MKYILQTDLVRIIDDKTQYAVHIRLSKGGWIEHEPFERKQSGLVAALLLAADVNAGKFFPRRVINEKSEPLMIEKEVLAIEAKK